MTNPIVYKWVLACMGTITPLEVQLEVYTEHPYMSHCHVGITTRGFEYPQQQCFCIERRDND
jgi:hypothetical protein